MSLWLSSLQLPQEALQRLWKAEGHAIPGDLEKLVPLLIRLKAPLNSEYQGLRKDYDSYVKFCESISLAPEDIQSTLSREEVTGPRGLNGLIEETQSKDVLKEIRVTFADIERLRGLERTLKDMEGLIDLLSKIRERFTNTSKQKGQELRLFIASTGKGLSFRLVYGLSEPELSNPRGPIREKGRTRELTFDSSDVESWMEYGMKAILGKGAKTEPLS